MEVVAVKRFGDEQSTLLDRYERMSFEVQLNRAILSRSLSEPGGPGRTGRKKSGSTSSVGVVGSSGLHRFLKKLLKPILGRKKKTAVNESTDGRDSPGVGKGEVLEGPKLGKRGFSRSVRF
ncbi:hypothetical protein LINGRAHAP2_LOCUS13119 [Linum grandiflorum]